MQRVKGLRRTTAMSARISVIKGRIIAVAAALALTGAGSALAGPSGGHGGGGGGFHAGGYHGGGYGGYHGGGYGGYRGGYGYRGGWGPGWHGGYYGGWHGYYGGGWGWRGGWGWGWGWGCCGVGLGWWLPVLPLGYATYYWSGIPYYYANSTYYVWDSSEGAYQAVEPPSGLTTTPPSSSSSAAATYPGVGASGNWTDLFAYPKGGQSMEQQKSDRDECHQWAVNQSGFDPAQPSGDPKDLTAKREAYLRAEGACLEARNYSVK
jgi:hypothetical protein